MTHVIDFWNRLKNVKKGFGLPTRRMREALLTGYLGPEMHAKLNLVYRARKKLGGML